MAFTGQINEKNGPLQFLLDRPTLGPSSRFTRYYGSSWLIKVKPSLSILSKPDKVKELKKLLLRPLILNSQVFRFFYAKSIKKDISLFLMATNEHYDGSIKLQCSFLNGQRVYNSFLDFFSNHNNLQENPHQVSDMLVNKVFFNTYYIIRQLQNGQQEYL